MSTVDQVKSCCGCGSVGRAVASDTRGPRYESSHRQKIIYIEHLFTFKWVLKDENKEKEAGNGPSNLTYKWRRVDGSISSDSYLALFCGQSYKQFTIVIYNSRLVPDLKIPHITTLEL